MKPSHEKIGIVVSRFNSTITKNLLKYCQKELIRQGVRARQIDVQWVPGAYELPFVVYQMARTKKYSAVIGLGCVIKGDTSHDVHISNWASFGIGLASFMTHTPCLFGVLTPNTEAQAIKRSQPGPFNRGKEVAEAAVEMIALKKINRRKK